MDIDFIIVNDEKKSYENYIKDAINEIICNHHLEYKINFGIFILNNISKEDNKLLEVRSNLIFNGSEGNIALQLDDYDYELIKKLKGIKHVKKSIKNAENLKNINPIIVVN